MGSTFAMVCFAWVFFRADTISGALNYIKGFTELPTSDKPITHVVYTAFVWIGVMGVAVITAGIVVREVFLLAMAATFPVLTAHQVIRLVWLADAERTKKAL